MSDQITYYIFYNDNNTPARLSRLREIDNKALQIERYIKVKWIEGRTE